MAQRARSTLVGIVSGLLVGFSPMAHAQSREDSLLQAVANNDVGIVRTLLASGANPNARNDRGHPALLVAAIKGSPEIVIALTEKGALVDLGSKDDGFTPLMAAAAKGDAQIVRMLLVKNAAVDARDDKGGTAMMAAALGGHAGVLSMLLANGGDVNADDKGGTTALMLAASQCRVAATKTLWNAGARVEETDNSGNTAWTYAAIGNCPLIIRTAGADECKDMSGLYPSEELRRWEPVFTRKLLEAKAEIERQLQSKGKDRLRQTRILTPLWAENCKQPVYYVSSSSRQEIVIPLLSVKFLHDLLYASYWARRNGYLLKSHLYVNMLKYRRAIDFSPHRYPSPFDALGIPHTSAGEPRYDNSEGRDQFDVIFNDVLFFVVAHEAAHVVLNHVRSTPQNETLADVFAIEILSRYGKFPVGISDFFLFASYWALNGGDFEDLAQYRIWLTAEATHPPSASRIQLLAASLYENPQRNLPSLPESHPNVTRIKDMALALMDIAETIDRDTTVTDMFGMALHTNLSSLAPEKEESINKLERIRRKWMFR